MADFFGGGGPAPKATPSPWEILLMDLMKKEQTPQYPGYPTSNLGAVGNATNAFMLPLRDMIQGNYDTLKSGFPLHAEDFPRGDRNIEWPYEPVDWSPGVGSSIYNWFKEPVDFPAYEIRPDDPYWKSLLKDVGNVAQDYIAEPFHEALSWMSGIRLADYLGSRTGEVDPNFPFQDTRPLPLQGGEGLPSADQGTQPFVQDDPFTQLLQMMAGGGGTTRTRVGEMSAPPIDYTAGLPTAPTYAAPDYTRAREALDAARPTEQKIDPSETLAAVLGGAALASAKGQTVGETLALAGGGAALALSDQKERERALKTQFDLQSQQWYSAKAALEQGVAGAEAAAAHQTMESAYQHQLLVHQATLKNLEQMQPNMQVSGNNIIMTKFNPETGMVETTVDHLSSSTTGSLASMLSLMKFQQEYGEVQNQDYMSGIGIAEPFFSIAQMGFQAPELFPVYSLASNATMGTLPELALRGTMEELGLDYEELVTNNLTSALSTADNFEEIQMIQFQNWVRIFGNNPQLASAMIQSIADLYPRITQ